MLYLLCLSLEIFENKCFLSLSNAYAGIWSRSNQSSISWCSREHRVNSHEVDEWYNNTTHRECGVSTHTHTAYTRPKHLVYHSYIGLNAEQRQKKNTQHSTKTTTPHTTIQSKTNANLKREAITINMYILKGGSFLTIVCNHEYCVWFWGYGMVTLVYWE